MTRAEKEIALRLAGWELFAGVSGWEIDVWYHAVLHESYSEYDFYVLCKRIGIE